MWAASDESERSGVMLLAVVLVEPGAVDGVRRTMRALLLPGERRIHSAKESPRRRRAVIDAVSRLEGTSATVFRVRRTLGTTRIDGRRELIQAATAFAVRSGVASWVLDDQDEAQAVRDRTVIAAELRTVDPPRRPVYEHRRGASEPLLWVADAVCWAVGAGGEWSVRLSDLITVIELTA